MGWKSLMLAALLVPALAQAQSSTSPDAAAYDAPVASRTTATGNWRGMRERLADKGIVITLAATYTLQGLMDGGATGPLFDQFSDESHTGNTFSTDLAIEFDTAKAGFWQGGTFSLQAEARAGRSVLQRAGSVSAVDNDALFPNVVDDFDDGTAALTEATYTQYLTAAVAVFGGLMNTAEGDANELAGSALSHEHFLNSALLYSLVEDASVPNVSLGGGISYEPGETLSGSLSVFGTSESAGENPFDEWHGTTFTTEWTLSHRLFGLDGAQTLGILYGIDASRADIAADPRTVLAAVLQGQPVPSTEADTWALYYNAHQFIIGDSNGGWGVFARFGLSDGDPNVVKWNAAGGFGSTGFAARQSDRWGIGTFYLGMSDADLLQGLGVHDEIGGDVFYNVAVMPWLRFTLDAQLIESALPRTDTAWLLALRTHVDL